MTLFTILAFPRNKNGDVYTSFDVLAVSLMLSLEEIRTPVRRKDFLPVSTVMSPV
jgi:hypothetical protein